MKAGKKMYCDLLFTAENESFIRWIEELETLSQQKLFESRAKWFESELEMHDIEASFTSSLKIFKSGKYYILRTIIPTRLGKCSLKLFDENEEDVDAELVKDQTNVISILQVVGIKCSARNFQIDFECKQMMIISPEVLFETCVIKTHQEPKVRESLYQEQDTPIQDKEDEIPRAWSLVPSNHKEEGFLGEMTAINEDHPELTESALENETVANDLGQRAFGLQQLTQKVASLPDEFGTQSFDNRVPDLEMEEIVVNINDVNPHEPLQLKNRNDVYYNIYKEAIAKAKEDRKLAIRSYLAAKQIKELYKLNDLDDDSDHDSEQESEHEILDIKHVI